MGLPINTDMSSGGLFPMILIRIVLSISMIKRIFLQAFILLIRGSNISQVSDTTPSDQFQEDYTFSNITKCSVDEIRNSLPPSVYLPDEVVVNGNINAPNSVPDLIDKVCTVCLYEFERGQEIHVLADCKHVFHRPCLDQWLLHRHTTCPLCRISLLPCDILKKKKKKQQQRLSEREQVRITEGLSFQVVSSSSYGSGSHNVMPYLASIE